MVCTARARSELYQIDAMWMIKFRLRIIQNTVSGLSIGAAVFTLSHPSEFVPDGWKVTGHVAYYLPIVILTILWNTVNIIWLGKNRRPLPAKPNAGVHTVLGLACLIFGVVCTVNVAGARGKLFNDPYDLQTDGKHDVVAANGTIVVVSSRNVASCPAFPDCAAQQNWLDRAYLRSGIAVGGCVLVDVAFLLHAVLSIWFALNAIHGIDLRPAIPHNEEMNKYEEKPSWGQDGKAVTKPERSFGNNSWNHSNVALLPAKATLGVHDAGSQLSIAVSVMSAQDSPRFQDSHRGPLSPAFSSSSHFSPPGGTPGSNSIPSPPMSQIQRMVFPHPVKFDSSTRMGEHDRSISPFSFPQLSQSGTSTPNFSRPSSRAGDTRTSVPTQYSFYPQVAHSVSQKSPSLSQGLSFHSESNQRPKERPKTADLSQPENDLTALPPFPPKDRGTSQNGW